MAEDEGGKCHRRADGFKTARRHGDDEALDLTLQNAAELICDGLDVPIASKRVTGRDEGKDRLDEAVEVAAKNRSDHLRICIHDFVSLFCLLGGSAIPVSSLSLFSGGGVGSISIPWRRRKSAITAASSAVTGCRFVSS